MIDKINFDKGIAKIVGVNSAIMFNYLLSRTPKDKDSGTDDELLLQASEDEDGKASDGPFYFDGYHWENIDIKLIHDLFLFFTYKQIDEALDELRNEGFIITGDYDEAAGFSDRKSDNYIKSKYGERLWFKVTKSGRNLVKKIKTVCINNYRLGLISRFGDDGWIMDMDVNLLSQVEFYTEIAEIVGVDSAIIFEFFYFSMSYANLYLCTDLNCWSYFDGHRWNNIRIDALQNLFSFLTFEQIDEAIKKLVNKGFIVIGDYTKAANNRCHSNRFKHDKTIWYRFTEYGKDIMKKIRQETEEDSDSDLPF